MSELFGSPFCFKSFLDPNSSPFLRFQCILYDSVVLLSGFPNLYKLKRGDLISGGNQFCRMTELFGPPFCISILKVLWTQILRCSLHFNVFWMIQGYFSKSLKISRNKRGGPNFWGNQFCRMSELFGPPFCISVLKASLIRKLTDINWCLTNPAKWCFTDV